MDGFWHDVRVGLRSLRRSPGFSVVAALTLALGIGATSAVVTIANAVLVRGLPYRDPERLVMLRGRMEKDGKTDEWPLGYQDLEALAGEREAFEALSPASGARPFNLSADGRVEHVSGEMVGADFFRVLGVGTVLGRTFTPAEAAAPNAARLVVLSHDFWRGRFGSDPGVVGKTVQLNEQGYTVIGVAERGFGGTSDEAQLWLPIGLARDLYGVHYTEMRPYRWLSGVARLRPGLAGVEDAQRAVDAASRRMAEQFPAENEGFSVRLVALPEAYFGELRRPLLSLLGAAAFVLLIACTNVANLFLARGAARRRETAVRAALGAGAGRLVRHQVAEGLPLVAVGALLGLLVAQAVTRLLVAGGLLRLQSFVRLGVDPVVVGVTLGVSLLCALAFGAVPVLLAARVAPVEGLADGGGRGGTGGVARGRFQRALVAAEVALALTLLAGAGLMVKGFRHFLSTDLGFAPERVLTMRLDLTGERYRENPPVFALARALLDRVGAVPGVRQVALEGPGLPTSGWYGAHFTREGDAGSPPEQYMARRHHVSPGYFAAMGIPLRAGRDFTSADVPEAPRAVVVSEAFARRVWPDVPAVGQRLRSIGPSPVPYTVVGVVGEVEHAGLNTDALRASDIYISVFQSPPRSPAVMNVIARTATARPAELTAALRASIAEAAPGLPPYDVQTMEERLSEQTSEARLLVLLMGAFAALALALAAVGIYGVLAYVVAQRTRELGIRAALGARPGDLVRHVLAQGLRPVVVGVAIGVVGVLALTRLITAMLYGVSPTDPLTLVGVAALLLAVAAAACCVPALRAARVDPQEALRDG